MCDAGRRLGDLIVHANQEHGIVAVRPESGRCAFPVGGLLRMLPNHACATAAQHDRYYVVLRADKDAPLARWPRFGGW